MSTLYALFLWISALMSTDDGSCGTAAGSAAGTRSACSASADDGASIYNGF